VGRQTLAIRQLCRNGRSFSILGGVRGPPRQADRAVALLAVLAHITGCLRGLQSDQWPSNISCVFEGASGAAGIQAETRQTVCVLVRASAHSGMSQGVFARRRAGTRGVRRGRYLVTRIANRSLANGL